MKQQVHPAVLAVVVIVAIGIVLFIFMKGTQGGGNVPPGGVGNAGPFSPGGAAVGKGGTPAQAPGTGPGGSH